MQSRWMQRRNEVTGENEYFYPITHKNAIIGMEELTANYLPLNGGTLTGPIEFNYNNYYGEMGPGFFLRYNDASKNSYGYLQILDNSQPLEDRVRFFDYDGSKQTSYDIYGEHNKPTPADIGASEASHTHNYAGSSTVGGSADNANKLLNTIYSNVQYVTNDTHILKLGYWKCTNTFDSLTLLFSSSFWGNQHGSSDIIYLRQDLNDNGSGTVRCTLSRTCLMRYETTDREFYYVTDNTNRRVYLYVKVHGGNSYGKWSTSVLQSTNDNWVSEYAVNQTISGQVLISEPYLNTLNRGTAVNVANTDYTTHMARAFALSTSTPSSLTNGTCTLVYA